MPRGQCAHLRRRSLQLRSGVERMIADDGHRLDHGDREHEPVEHLGGELGVGDVEKPTLP